MQHCGITIPFANGWNRIARILVDVGKIPEKFIGNRIERKVWYGLRIQSVLATHWLNRCAGSTVRNRQNRKVAYE